MADKTSTDKATSDKATTNATAQHGQDQAQPHVAAQQSNPWLAGMPAMSAMLPEMMQTWTKMAESTMASSTQFAGPFLQPLMVQSAKLFEDNKARMAGFEAEYVKAEAYGLAQLEVAMDEMSRLGKAGLQWYGTMATSGRTQAWDAVRKAQDAVAQATTRVGA